jgi:hypothetical protein
MRIRCMDVDENGASDALTDGLLVLRRLFGFSGTALVEDAVSPDAQRIDAVVIGDYIDGLGNALDIDLNEHVDALTDGLLTLRRLFAFDGEALIGDAVAPDAQITDAATSANRIGALR